ncbi:MAG: dihydroneopterin aldolase [Candidatus Delongbacteria bacterium]|nr:dihydroneopterin aldolase [Candidatus Delongbacteria bacterium]
MKIMLKNIEIQALIGTLHHERNSDQKIFIDIEFDYDASEAAAEDKLEHAVDYSEIMTRAIEIAKNGRFYLIETLASKIADMVRSYGQITSASVEVRKPSALKNAGSVSAKANF